MTDKSGKRSEGVKKGKGVGTEATLRKGRRVKDKIERRNEGLEKEKYDSCKKIKF